MEDRNLWRSRSPASPSRASSPCTKVVSIEPRMAISTFEHVISSYPTVFESLLLQLPTSSILNLYHTSECLRVFLQHYPTAWKFLSFRSRSPGRVSPRQASPGSDASGESRAPISKAYSLDLLLINIVLPFGTRLKSLELDHTAVNGESLAHCVLHTRRDTLQHLSIRGCKQVSLKYHIVPFLNIFSLQKTTTGPVKATELALKSLYTFRCRHHRRRPYTTASRSRNDSDSAPTHDLIQLCHELGIWTDTAWCPTPGGRCLRRKDYSSGRGTPDAKFEVWVVFDRLWRSRNRLGSSKDVDNVRAANTRGQLWQDAELGYEGEPLGSEPRPGQGEGKGLPTHLRKSHEIFIDQVKCHDCGAGIEERCEHCSIRMHCMGCRKTLCQNCAFSRPLPQANNHDRQNSVRFWWAQSQARSPNLMMQEITPDVNLTSVNVPNSIVTPVVKMQWCCLRPMFSNGGSITFVSPSLTNSATDQVRAAPLPRGKGYEDAELARLRQDLCTSRPAERRHLLDDQLSEKGDAIINRLSHCISSKDYNPCPRSLCQECWETPGWRSACQACKEPFCFAHDLQNFNMRICGYRDLSTEKAMLEERTKFKNIMVVWQRSIMAQDIARDEAEGMFRTYLTCQELTADSLRTLEAIVPLIKWPLASGDELCKDIDNLVRRRDTTTRSKTLGHRQSDHDDGKKSHSATLVEEHNGTRIYPLALTEKDDPLGVAPTKKQGCGSIMCPKHRSIGDPRPTCTAATQQCILCNVHICPECLTLEPACDCSYCKDHYRCRNCFHFQKELCKKAEEAEEKRKRQEETRRRKAEAIRMLKVADEMAATVGQFFDGVLEISDPSRTAVAEPLS